jgi:hypothetical protein
VHATIWNPTETRAYHETQECDVYHRYLLQNADGPVSMRIGDDGRARIA